MKGTCPPEVKAFLQADWTRALIPADVSHAAAVARPVGPSACPARLCARRAAYHVPREKPTSGLTASRWRAVQPQPFSVTLTCCSVPQHGEEPWMHHRHLGCSCGISEWVFSLRPGALRAVTCGQGLGLVTHMARHQQREFPEGRDHFLHLYILSPSQQAWHSSRRTDPWVRPETEPVWAPFTCGFSQCSWVIECGCTFAVWMKLD